MITLFAVILVALILFVGTVGIHEIRTTKGKISNLRKALRGIVSCAFCILITVASVTIYFFCSLLWFRVSDAGVLIDGHKRTDCLVFERKKEYVVAVPNPTPKNASLDYTCFILDPTISMYATSQTADNGDWGSFYVTRNVAMSYEEDPFQVAFESGYGDNGKLEYSRNIFAFCDDVPPRTNFIVTLPQKGYTGH
jgi:hypothetical protein